ncbi:MAG: SDR family NAD(P)-dependent oxidoreductase [Fimbriimonadaceae bacterium]|nr:SDR family NAD(P)-dependent oxidoreductase [Fimbriimonadaceae bacterium]
MRRLLITGASSGIGRAFAIHVGRETDRRLVLAGRSETRLEDVASRCACPVETFIGDLDDPVVARRLVAFAEERLGRLDGLVNVAGNAEYGPYDELPWSSVEGQIAINLLAPMATTHAALPAMLARGSGRILNVLSIAAVHPFPFAGPYVAAKAGLLAFSRSLNAEVRKRGVRVQCVLPGATDSPLWDGGDHPPREKMLTCRAVAETMRDALDAPDDRALDEIVLMPPEGIL